MCNGYIDCVWVDYFSHIAYKSAIREQKLALEISAAKRERDFYLSKVDQSRKLSSIEERMKKVNNCFLDRCKSTSAWCFIVSWLNFMCLIYSCNCLEQNWIHDFACLFDSIVFDFLQKQKVQEETGMNSELPVSQKKVIRQFPQKKPVAVDKSQGKPRLSKEVLAGVSIAW